jgi:hypothetical protein
MQKTLKTSKLKNNINNIIMFRNKKGQFYIFMALILIGYAALLLNPFSVVPDPSYEFKKTYNNFAFESGAALNNALFGRENVNTEYERFLNNFISYAKMKKLSIEIVSVLETGERVYVSNKMNSSVQIINLNQTISAGVNTYFTRSNLSEVVLEVKDDVFHENIYKFTISEQGTDAKAVLRLRTGSKQEMFVVE